MRYELVSVLVMCFGRSNGCYGLSAKLCIYTFLFLLFLTGLISLLLFIWRFQNRCGQEEEESGRRRVVLFEESWRVVNSAEVGGGVVVVLWHDVGRLCRFFFWSVLPRAVRWRAAREVPSVVVAVFVVSSSCVLSRLSAFCW